MMKKPGLIYAVIAALAGVAVATYYFLSFPNVYDAIPNSGVAVIQVNNWTQFESKLSTSYTGMELKKTPLIQRLLNKSETLKDFFEITSGGEWQFQSGKTVASLHLVSADDYDFLFTSPVSGWNEKELLDHIRNKKQVREVNERIFKGQKVLDILLADGKQISVAKVKGILAISYTSFLVENSIKAIHGGNNIEDDKSFRSLRKKFAPSGDMSIYFNFRKSDVILPVAVKSEKVPLLRALNSFADWGAYNFSFSNQTLEFNGLACLGSSIQSAKGNNPLSNQPILSTIPDNASILILYATTDVLQTSETSSMSKLKAEASALAIMETLEEDFNNQSVLILKSKDVHELQKTLIQLGASELPADSLTDRTIYYIKNTTVLSPYLAKGMVQWEEAFFSFMDDIAVFAGNKNTLSFALDKINKGETLDKDNKFSELKSTVKNSNGNLIYIHPGRAEMLIQGLVSEKSSMKNYLLQFGDILIHSIADEEWISTSGVFRTGSEKRTVPGILWRTSLQSIASYPPQIVLNVNTQEKEIFTQDTAGNIYLLNKGGEILFTRPIEEPIIGNVYQLDYYKSGKLQYIFNTASQVFIIDRFGNDVASYPLRLSCRATAGLTLTYQSASRTYNYYVPCENEAVYGYEGTGRPLPGWSPRAMVGLCTKPLQPVKHNNADCLLAFTEDGKLLLMDERGKWLWGINNLPVTKQNFSVVNQKNDFVLLNASGKELTEISSDGNDRIRPLLDEAFFFAATNVSDTSYLYFYSSNNVIRSYDGKGNFKHSAFLKDADISSIEIIYIAAEKHLLVKDENASKIYIYNLSLEPEGVLTADNIAAVTIADLLDRNEFIAITSDKKGHIMCSRIR